MNPHPEPSDAELDEPGLSALYRQGATQTPPAELDRRILDQAQAALKSRPGSEPSRRPGAWNRLSRWPWNWSGPWSWRRLAIPLSSAAAILLALGLVLRVLDEQGAMPSAIPGAVPGAMRGEVQGLRPGAVQGLTDMARPPLAEYQSSGPSGQSGPSGPSGQSGPSGPSQPARPERGIAAKRASEEAIGSIPTRALEEVKGLSAGAGLSRPPSPAPASAVGALAPAQTKAPQTPTQTPDQAQTQAQDEEQPEAHARGPAMPIPESAGEVHLKSRISDEMPQVAPERWLEEIRQKWSSGGRAEAIRQLAAFRRVHPNYPLPEDLRSLLGAE